MRFMIVLAVGMFLVTARADVEPVTFEFGGKVFFRMEVDVYSNRCVSDYYTSPNAPALWDEMLSLTTIWGPKESDPKKYFEAGHLPDRPLFGEDAAGAIKDSRNGDWVVQCVTKPVRTAFVPQKAGGRSRITEFPWLYWNYSRLRVFSGGFSVLDYTVADREGRMSETAFGQRMREVVLPRIDQDFSALDRYSLGHRLTGTQEQAFAYSDSKMRFCQLVLEPDGAVSATLVDALIVDHKVTYPLRKRLAGFWRRSGSQLELELALWAWNPADPDVDEMNSRSADHFSLPFPLPAAGQHGLTGPDCAWQIRSIGAPQSGDSPPVLLVGHGPLVMGGETTRQGGRVDVVLHVDVDGSVSRSAVKRSTNPSLDKDALDAVAHWRFLPKRKNGAAVPAEVVVPMVVQPTAK